jgi:hypothetical protein
MKLIALESSALDRFVNTAGVDPDPLQSVLSILFARLEQLLVSSFALDMRCTDVAKQDLVIGPRMRQDGVCRNSVEMLMKLQRPGVE